MSALIVANSQTIWQISRPAVQSHARPNKRMNLTVRPVTRLADFRLETDSHGSAQGACPSRPAGYARR